MNRAPTMAKGKGYQALLDSIDEMEIIPCYILIFNFYIICKLWKENRLKEEAENSKEFACYACMFWYRSVCKHMSIGKNIKKYIKDFFKDL